MAITRVRGSGQRVITSPARSLLVCLQLAGVPIQTLCGGRARCGKCAIRVHTGAEWLTAPLPRETERLAAIGAPVGTRLACQTHTRGDGEIEILNPGPATAAAP